MNSDFIRSNNEEETSLYVKNNELKNDYAVITKVISRNSQCDNLFLFFSKFAHK